VLHSCVANIFGRNIIFRVVILNKIFATFAKPKIRKKKQLYEQVVGKK
jgi:hypothetical protein